MKRVLLSLVLFGLILTAKAQVTAEGYLVLTGQDTVKCTIKLAGKKKVTGYNNLVIVNETGEETVYEAETKQVQAFGFEILGVKQEYRFVELPKKWNSGFFVLKESGPNFKLYSNYLAESDDYHYAIFKPNGDYLEVTTHAIGNWRKKLQDFFSDSPEALKFIESMKSKEIPELIKKLNSTIS